MQTEYVPEQDVNVGLVVCHPVQNAIAEALDMKPGGAVPLSLAQTYPQWVAPWDALRHKHDLISPGLEQFVGLSFQYADYSMRYGQTQPGPPSIVSTVRSTRPASPR